MDTPAATDSLTAALEELRHRFGERLLTSDAAREHHGSGELHFRPNGLTP